MDLLARQYCAGIEVTRRISSAGCSRARRARSGASASTSTPSASSRHDARARSASASRTGDARRCSAGAPPAAPPRGRSAGAGGRREGPSERRVAMRMNGRDDGWRWRRRSAEWVERQRRGRMDHRRAPVRRARGCRRATARRHDRRRGWRAASIRGARRPRRGACSATPSRAAARIAWSRAWGSGSRGGGVRRGCAAILWAAMRMLRDLHGRWTSMFTRAPRTSPVSVEDAAAGASARC